jgi:hypothetical protein
MRVSIEEKDPGRETYARLRALGRDVRVLLNGVPLDNCVTADDERGFVRVVAAEACGEAKRIVTLYGRVAIEIYDARLIALDHRGASRN